ncbi:MULTISPECIES: hypothetical protein [unclassified Pseudoalteromonas]|uniref:hypothetical protein n=1 Tax=unclassified Pseudoalteromonas TaxID=194690 RepID=UPI0023588C44|nr:MULTISPECIES: hypothetical protein [unclassified Pseudoalteromonas]MDC9564833.1 hypothetical protein [Pseudoalteromonas sp. GAB2316C]MDC9569295.1 hypothetical protein [Pseudoalteromonas sp. GABNB9D]MDC9573393.1 hypothetical protein [Pseudoalteromonas sp. GABNS16A]MDC9577638.1 hypothetical protein [Pseudoalteromonas sp. GABNS16E]MDC9585291.1 hypothetical protein [Pseudoalteromonas sp. GABNS16C]
MVSTFLNNLSIIETSLLSFELDDLDNAEETRANLFALIKVASKFDEYLDQINSVRFKPTDVFYNKGHHAYKDHFNAAKNKLLIVIKSIRREVNYGALDLVPLSKPETISLPWLWENISVGSFWKVGGIILVTHGFAFGIGVLFS